MASSRDPLACLPVELTLRILDFVHVRDLAQLTLASRAWHDFIDIAQRDAIYGSSSKVRKPEGAHNFDFLQNARSFAKYYDGVSNWKEFCKRQTVLDQNLNSGNPFSSEAVIQVDNNPVWRFRPDFKRRFFISTTQGGGLHTTDFDGTPLWRLQLDEVRPYAHLEYHDGLAVWDRWGNALEIWKVNDDPAAQRGSFRQLALLQHDCETRGFMLRGRTLCVVSTQGKAFVYDLFDDDQPKLRLQMSIEKDAVGHLDQTEDLVMYSMGTRGYHVYSKIDGSYVGALKPKFTTHFYHVNHPRFSEDHGFVRDHGATARAFPPMWTRRDRFTQLRLHKGSHHTRSSYLCLAHDDWGAGMMVGNFMIGVSRGGRVFLCSDLKGALFSSKRAEESTAIIECEADGSQFDLGGWLSVHDGRALFEISDRIYIFGLTLDSDQPRLGDSQPLIYAISTGSAPRFAVPVSWMGIFDDNIMYTYTTLGKRIGNVASPQAPFLRNRTRIFPTKTIRVVSLAPATEHNVPSIEDEALRSPSRGCKRRASSHEEEELRRLTRSFPEDEDLELWSVGAHIAQEDEHHDQDEDDEDDAWNFENRETIPELGMLRHDFLRAYRNENASAGHNVSHDNGTDEATDELLGAEGTEYMEGPVSLPAALARQVHDSIRRMRHEHHTLDMHAHHDHHSYDNEQHGEHSAEESAVEGSQRAEEEYQQDE